MISWYDFRGYFILRLSYRTSLRRVLKFFERISTRHLEVGVGSGTLLKMRLRKYPKWIVHAIDIDQAAIEKLRHPCVKASVGSATSIDHPDDTFNTVHVANAFHCFSDPDGALKEMHRVLRPGGRLLMNVLLTPLDGSIADRINVWGRRKGILERTYDVIQIRAMMAKHFPTFYVDIHGNSAFITATKEGGDPYAAIQ